MREWLVIENSYRNAVFRPDNADAKGYIPRDEAEKLLSRDLGGMCWFTKADYARMRAHPEWHDTAPPSSRERSEHGMEEQDDGK